MSKTTQTKRSNRDDVKPSDKYAQSDQAPPPGGDHPEEMISDPSTEDKVVNASEDSFPASDPPGFVVGKRHVDDTEKDSNGSTRSE